MRAQHEGDVPQKSSIGPFALDRERLTVAHAGAVLALAPKTVACFAYLVDHDGVVAKDELLDALWPGADVEEANLSQHVYLLRKALGACDPDYRRAIVTIPKRGYRFVVPEPLVVAATPPVLPAPPRIPTRWLAACAALLLLGLGAFGLWPAARHAAAAPAAAPALSKAAAENLRLGWYDLDLRTPTGIRRSRTYFARVIASDPASPAGYAALADALVLTGDYDPGRRSPMSYQTEATRLARRAVALDPASAAAHTALGLIAYYGHKPKTAARELALAETLDPAYAPAHLWLGCVRFDDADFPGSVRELEAATSLNPVSTAASAWLQEAYYFVGRYDDAILYGRRALELNPNRFDALKALGVAYAARRDFKDALATFRKIPPGDMAYRSVPLLVAAVYARAGEAGRARNIVAQFPPATRFDKERAFALIALGQRREAAAAIAHMRFSGCRDRLIFVRDPRLADVRDAAEFAPTLRSGCTVATS